MRVSIKTKVIVPIILLNILVFVVQIFLFKGALQNVLYDEFRSKGEALAKSLASSVQDTLLNRDASTIQGFIDQYRNIKGVDYIFIINDSKEIAAHTFSPAVPDHFIKVVKNADLTKAHEVKEVYIHSERVIAVESPILAGLLGRVYLGMSLGQAEREVLVPLITKNFIFGGGFFFIILNLSIFILYRVIKPVLTLTKTSKEIVQTNNLDLRVEIKEQDEIGDLASSFNVMLKKLKDHRDNLESMVNERTAVIERQQMQLAEASKLSSLGEMAAGIAHEINNPLAIISASMRTIEKLSEKGKLTDELLIEIVTDVNHTVSRVGKIISGLRNVSRDSSDDDVVEVPIRDILSDVLGLCSEKIKHNDVNFDCNLAEEKFGTLINCNRVQISQVLLNLIGNSYHAVEELEERWIKVEVRDGVDFVEVAVNDSGPGIPKDIQEKMFNPFFTSKEVGKGTGLGLSISMNIMKKHNGSLYVDNTLKHTSIVLRFKKELS
jgi:signal transduction histidine kinase